MQTQKPKNNPTQKKAVPVFLWLVLAGLMVWNAVNIWLHSSGLLRFSIGFLLEQASIFASTIEGSVVFSSAILVLFLLWLIYRYYPIEQSQANQENKATGEQDQDGFGDAKKRDELLEEDHALIELPNRRQREAILSRHTADIPLAPNVNLGRIARSTTGFSEENLAFLCKEASQIAARQERSLVNMADFEEALDRMLLIEGLRILPQDEERHIAAFHEAGHVLIAWRMMAYPSIKTASIISRKQDAASCRQTLEKLRHPADQDSLFTSLSILLAGRAAEEVGVGMITTTGAEDLQQATQLAYHMIAQWGMGSFGVFIPEALRDVSQEHTGAYRGQIYSEETAVRIEQELQDLLQARYKAVRGMLANEKHRLTQLAETLMEDETIDHEVIARILGDHPGDDIPLIETAAIQHQSKVS